MSNPDKGQVCNKSVFVCALNVPEIYKKTNSSGKKYKRLLTSSYLWGEELGEGGYHFSFCMFLN